MKLRGGKEVTKKAHTDQTVWSQLLELVLNVSVTRERGEQLARDEHVLFQSCFSPGGSLFISPHDILILSFLLFLIYFPLYFQAPVSFQNSRNP